MPTLVPRSARCLLKAAAAWLLSFPVRITRPRPARSIPQLEPLEDRTLLTGMAIWTSIGPTSQTWNIPNPYIPQGTTTSGRVSAINFGQFQNQPAMYVGAAGGGVWVSTDYMLPNPTWQPLTDAPAGVMINPVTGVGSGALAVGSIAVAGQNVFVGTGEANYSGDSHYGTGILVSTDGGATFPTLVTGATGTEFYQHSVSKIIVVPSGVAYAAVLPRDGGKSAGAGALPQDPAIGVY